TLGTLTFLNTWNDFLFPLVVTSSDEMRPLTVGLATLANQTGNAGFFMAGATVSFLPTFAFFLAMQRYVVPGVSLSGLNGSPQRLAARVVEPEVGMRAGARAGQRPAGHPPAHVDRRPDPGRKVDDGRIDRPGRQRGRRRRIGWRRDDDELGVVEQDVVVLGRP